jgi:hypothetical protein
LVEDERRSKNALRQSETQLLKGARRDDQLRFERLSTDISSMLMDAPAELENRSCRLGQIAQMLGFDAVSLWLTGKDAALRAYGWRERIRPGCRRISRKDFPWLARELLRVARC